jgi:hypothetical protein
MREKRLPAWQSSRDPVKSALGASQAGLSKKEGSGGLENSGGGREREHNKPLATFLMRQPNRLSQKIDPAIRLSDSAGHRGGGASSNRSAANSFDVHRVVSSSPLIPINQFHEAPSSGMFFLFIPNYYLLLISSYCLMKCFENFVGFLMFLLRRGLILIEMTLFRFVSARQFAEQVTILVTEKLGAIPKDDIIGKNVIGMICSRILSFSCSNF